MGVPRGTTPTLVLTFSDETLDLTQASHVYVTIKATGQILTKTGADLDVEARQISVFLGQSETLAFAPGRVQLQVNWIYADGKRGASEIAYYDFSPQLLGSVLP